MIGLETIHSGPNLYVFLVFQPLVYVSRFSDTNEINTDDTNLEGQVANRVVTCVADCQACEERSRSATADE
jgi:hypothetical protein